MSMLHHRLSNERGGGGGGAEPPSSLILYSPEKPILSAQQSLQCDTFTRNARTVVALMPFPIILKNDKQYYHFSSV